MEQLTVTHSFQSVTTASLEHLKARGSSLRVWLAFGILFTAGRSSGRCWVVRLGHPVLPALKQTPPPEGGGRLPEEPLRSGWEGSSSQCWAEADGA